VLVPPLLVRIGVRVSCLASIRFCMGPSTGLSSIPTPLEVRDLDYTHERGHYATTS
jgi:hypothetical protein